MCDVVLYTCSLYRVGFFKQFHPFHSVIYSGFSNVFFFFSLKVCAQLQRLVHVAGHRDESVEAAKRA